MPDEGLLDVGALSDGSVSAVESAFALHMSAALQPMTTRSVSERTCAHVHEGIERVAENIAAAHGCDGNVEIIYGYPVTTNDDKFAESAERHIRPPSESASVGRTSTAGSGVSRRYEVVVVVVVVLGATVVAGCETDVVTGPCVVTGTSVVVVVVDDVVVVAFGSA